MTFEEFIEEWRSDAPVIKARTSGSTGTPKIIELPKPFVAASARRTVDFFGLDSESVLYSCVSPDFIGGKMMGVRAELTGAKLRWEIPSNRPLQSVDKEEHISLLAVVPSQMVHILDNWEQLPRIDNIIVGGSAIHPELRKRIEASGLNAWETYGMTETASHVALRRIYGDSEPFTMLPGISVSLDERGCLVFDFESGERVVTNDIGTIEDCRRFMVKGRADNVIITGGKKLHPEEAEDKLSRFIVAPFVVKGVADSKWGERVELHIEGESESGVLSPGVGGFEGLYKCMDEMFEHWQVPKKIRLVSKLERTANGKIKRQEG